MIRNRKTKLARNHPSERMLPKCEEAETLIILTLPSYPRINEICFYALNSI